MGYLRNCWAYYHSNDSLIYTQSTNAIGGTGRDTDVSVLKVESTKHAWISREMMLEKRVIYRLYTYLYLIFIYVLRHQVSERWRQHNLTSIAGRSQPSPSIAPPKPVDPAANNAVTKGLFVNMKLHML